MNIVFFILHREIHNFDIEQFEQFDRQIYIIYLVPTIIFSCKGSGNLYDLFFRTETVSQKLYLQKFSKHPQHSPVKKIYINIIKLLNTKLIGNR